MLIAKYKKKGSASYVSHVDTLRTMSRIFARADMKIDFSEGFNPHMLVFFSPPNAVGVESLCEYVSVSTNDVENFIERFNKNAPCGFVAEKVWTTDKNPNLAKFINEAQFSVKCNDFGKTDLNKLNEATEFLITYNDKNGEKTKDFREYILALTKVNDDEIAVKLKFGNENLRPDRFVDGFRNFYNLPKEEFKIIKNKVFVSGQDVDEFLYSHCDTKF